MIKKEKVKGLGTGERAEGKVGSEKEKKREEKVVLVNRRPR